MSKSRYNANVRIGNWLDELVLEEEIIKRYIRKSEKSELKIQKTRKLFISLLEEVPLTFPVKGLIYGGAIQVLCPGVPHVSKFKVLKEQGLVLAAHMELENVDKRCVFDNEDPVIGTALLTPCVRNVWTLVSFKDEDLTDRQIRYGESLCIKLFKSNPPLYLEAPVVTPFTQRGECGYPVPKLTLWKTAYTRFKIVHPDSTLRYETEGQVVPAFEKVVILHAPTSAALAMEHETWFPTFFGMECEVSIHSYFQLKKPPPHTEKNLWMFVLASGDS